MNNLSIFFKQCRALKLKTGVLLTKRVYSYKPDTEPITYSLLNLIIRILLALGTGMWIAFFPTYLLIIYMKYHKFFSYDFFSDGAFGLSVFLGTILLMLLFMSLWSYGFIPMAKVACIEYETPSRKDYKAYQVITYVLFAFSILFHFSLYDTFTQNGHEFRMIWVCVLCFSFIGVITSLVGSNLARKAVSWIPSLLFILISAIAPLLFIDATADMVRLALKSFNVGGKVHAKVFGLSNQKTIIYEGNLLLLTSKSAYFQEEKQSYRLFRQNENIVISVGEN